MNGYHGFNSNGWSGEMPYGWSGDSFYGHPYVGGDIAAVLIPMAIFMFVVGLALIVFQIWLYYRIFTKAGYNGWWSLLCLVPGVGTMVVLLVLAFDNWPIHRGPTSQSPTPPTGTIGSYSPQQPVSVPTPAAVEAPSADVPSVPAAPAPAPEQPSAFVAAEPPVPAPFADTPEPAVETDAPAPVAEATRGTQGA